MIGHGRIVARGSLSELLGSGGGVRIRTLDDPAFARALQGAGIPVTRGAAEAGLLVDAEPEAVGRLAAASGAIVLEMRQEHAQDIEQMFLDLTSGTAREEVAA